MLTRRGDELGFASGCPAGWFMMASMEPEYEVVWPRSPRGVQRRRRAGRLDTLTGKRVAFLWDFVFRGDELFPVLERELTTRVDDVEIVGYETWGNLHGADEQERVGRLPDDLRSRGIDAVVSGMGC